MTDDCTLHHHHHQVTIVTPELYQNSCGIVVASRNPGISDKKGGSSRNVLTRGVVVICSFQYCLHKKRGCSVLVLIPVLFQDGQSISGSRHTLTKRKEEGGGGGLDMY